MAIDHYQQKYTYGKEFGAGELAPEGLELVSGAAMPGLGGVRLLKG